MLAGCFELPSPFVGKMPVLAVGAADFGAASIVRNVDRLSIFVVILNCLLSVFDSEWLTSVLGVLAWSSMHLIPRLHGEVVI